MKDSQLRFRSVGKSKHILSIDQMFLFIHFKTGISFTTKLKQKDGGLCFSHTNMYKD